MHLSLYVPADTGYVYKAAVLGVLINKTACILPSVTVLIAELSVCINTSTLQPYLLSIIFLLYSEITITHLSEFNSQV
jgi:hypothetical protein